MASVFIEDEKLSDSSSSTSNFTYKSIPVSPSILYEQRELYAEIQSKYRAVTFSTIKSFHKKGGEASCHSPGRKSKTLKCHQSPRVLIQGEIFMSM